MDMAEIRTGFSAAAEGYSQLDGIRLSRVDKIRIKQGPLPLSGGPTTIVHIIPFSVMNPTIQYDIRGLENDYTFFPMNGSSQAWNDQYTFDGIVRYSSLEASPTKSYVQFFRNGMVEACLAALSEAEGTKLYVPTIEEQIVKSLPQYFSALKKLGVSYPFMLAITMIRVRGYNLIPNSFMPTRVIPFREDDLVIPELLVETEEANLHAILRPAFDRIWNAAGRSSCASYDTEGNWKGARTIN